MSLTLVTSPLGTLPYKVFAGFRPIEYEFKREDLAITSVTSGTGGAKLTVGTDLTTYLSQGDVIYFYSEGSTTYVYNTSATILSITSTEITVDAPYIETGTGGYMNYLKNYYVELQCVNENFNDVNIMPFSFTDDGTASGVIKIDISVTNDLNTQRQALTQRNLIESTTTFWVKYREVYDNTPQSWTTLTDKQAIVLYCSDTPDTEEILNNFEEPCIFLGYPAYICVCHAGGSIGDEIELKYEEKNINKASINLGTLGNLDSGGNGFMLWEWDKDTVVDPSARYIEFNYNFVGVFDFADGDFAYPDFFTQ